MEMLAKQFIGKECLVYTVTDTMGSIQGTVKEVTRIREYPRNAKGKKKAFFA